MDPGPPPSESGAAAAPRRSPAQVAALFALLFLVLLVFWLERRPDRAAADAGVTDALKAEQYARAALAGQAAGDTLPGLASVGWSQVEDAYRAALKVNPALMRARRGLAAALYEEGNRAGAKAALNGPVDTRIQPIAPTVWAATRAAYGAAPRPRSAATLARYRAALQRPELGWSRYPALEALADGKAEAARWRAAMQRQYAHAGPWQGVMLVAAFLGVLGGLAVLSLYFSKPRPGLLERIPVPAATLGGLFALGLLLQLLPSALAEKFLPHRVQTEGLAEYLYTSLALNGGTCILAYGAAAWKLAPAGGLRVLGWNTRDLPKWVFGGGLCMLPLLLASLLVVGALQPLFPHVETPQNPAVGLVTSSHGPQLALVFLLVCVLAPIAEEFLFRGLLFRAIEKDYGFHVAAFASALTFAGLHPQLPFGFPPIFAIGVGLCYLYRASGSLVPGMVVHGLNNTVALLASLAAFGYFR